MCGLGLFGGFFWFVFVFGGVLWFVWVLFWYCIAIELLLFCWVVGGGGFRVFWGFISLRGGLEWFGIVFFIPILLISYKWF